MRESLRACARGWSPGAGALVCGLLTDWRDAVVRMVLRRLDPLPRGLAVFAVGGFGRRELAPHSDLDILVLVRRPPDAAAAAAISELLYHLWDAGYKVAPSTRTVRDLARDACEDHHLLTSLFASRPLGGDAFLHRIPLAAGEQALRRVRRSFLAEKMRDLAALVDGPLGDMLAKEPDLKASAGGLRSIQLLTWLAAAECRRPDNGAIERVLPAPVRARLDRSRDFLLHLRNVLQLLLDRHEDILRLDSQPAVAATLGVRGTDDRRAAKLMRAYYERAVDVLLCAHELRDRLDTGARRRSFRHSWYRADGGRLWIRPGDAPDALRALDAVVECARLGLRPTGSLISYLRAAARTIDSYPARELFVRFRTLLNAPHSYAALCALKLSGFLYAYVSPLRLVRNRAVHNPFHRVPVDQHSLDAVRELESFADRARSEPERFGLPARVAHGIRENIWVAKLALLLHDAGKAFDGDHAKDGAEIARAFMRGLPTDSLFKDMVVYLTENHLLLSSVGRSRAAGESGVVSDLAAEIARQPYPEEAAELLYLVTCADVAATNERAYTRYAAANLAALYTEARAALAPVPAPAPRSATGESAADDAGTQPLFVPEAIPRVDEAHVEVSVFNDHLKVSVVAPDRPGLFALLAGVLLVNGADIVRASIRTSGGTASDEFIVTDVHGNDILEARMEKELAAWIPELRASLARYWSDAPTLDRLIADLERRMKPVNPAFRRETAVTLRGTGNRRVLAEVACTDRPALLYDLAHRMTALGLDIRNASVDTSGWYVHDTFDLEAPVTVNDRRMEEIRAALVEAAAPRG